MRPSNDNAKIPVTSRDPSIHEQKLVRAKEHVGAGFPCRLAGPPKILTGPAEMEVAVANLLGILPVMKAASDPATKHKPGKVTTGVLPHEFTVRDMNRNTAKVLEAARKYGRVTIRSRRGDRFSVEPAVAVETGIDPQPDFRERIRRHRDRMKALGYTPPTEEGWAAISRAIAGE